MRLFPLFLAWPLSKEELVTGSSDPSHNPHLFSTQPRTRVRDKDPSLFKCGASLFFEIGQTSDDSPYQLREGVKKNPDLFGTLSQTSDPTHPPRTFRTPLSEK